METLTFGHIPRSITVILEADIVDKYNPGDDVVIVGYILRQWKYLAKGSRCNVDLAIRANRLVFAYFYYSILYFYAILIFVC
jgi:DNA helicase MCM9